MTLNWLINSSQSISIQFVEQTNYVVVRHALIQYDLRMLQPIIFNIMKTPNHKENKISNK